MDVMIGLLGASRLGSKAVPSTGLWEDFSLSLLLSSIDQKNITLYCIHSPFGQIYPVTSSLCRDLLLS